MGKIDRSNYEIHFLDYIDGNLSVDLVDDFLEFLDKNPDLKKELQATGQDVVKLPEEKMTYNHKNYLLRDELTGSTAFDYRVIACTEGDLTDQEQTGFEEELKDDLQKQQAFYLMKRLRLQPQSSISFPDKNSLLKSSRYNPLLWPARIAAILVLALVIGSLFRGNRQDTAPHRPAPVVSENRPSNLSHQEQQPQQQEEKIQAAPTKKPLAPAIEPQASGPVQTSSGKTILTTESIDHPREKEVMAALKPREVITVPVHIEPIRTLATNAREPHQNAEYTKLTDYLAQKLLDVPKGENVSLASLAKAGLQAAEQVSGNKFNVERSEEGKIAEINLNTRFFGFSIPIKKNK